MIYPTIGRKVWYYPDKKTIDKELAKVLTATTPFDASIVYVHDDITINVVAFDHLGYWVQGINVQIFDPDAVPEGASNYCTWMPYQVQRAKKPD